MAVTKSKIRRSAKWLLFRYKLSRLFWRWRKIILLLVGALLIIEILLMFYEKNRNVNLYYMYGLMILGFFPFYYGLKGLFLMMIGGLLKIALKKGGITVKAIIYKVEYIESWSSYQKGTFIFARPIDGVLDGMGYIFKSERLSFKIPEHVLRPGKIIGIYVDKKNINNYWMDIEGILNDIIKSCS